MQILILLFIHLIIHTFIYLPFYLFTQHIDFICHFLFYLLFFSMIFSLFISHLFIMIINFFLLTFLFFHFSLASMTGSDLVAAKIMKKARKMLLKSELFRKGGVKHMAHRTLDGAVLTGNYILISFICKFHILSFFFSP